MSSMGEKWKYDTVAAPSWFELHIFWEVHVGCQNSISEMSLIFWNSVLGCPEKVLWRDIQTLSLYHCPSTTPAPLKLIHRCSCFSVYFGVFLVVFLFSPHGREHAIMNRRWALELGRPEFKTLLYLYDIGQLLNHRVFLHPQNRSNHCDWKAHSWIL